MSAVHTKIHDPVTPPTHTCTSRYLYTPPPPTTPTHTLLDGIQGIVYVGDSPNVTVPLLMSNMSLDNITSIATTVITAP